MTLNRIRKERCAILETLVSKSTSDGSYLFAPIDETLDALEALDTEYNAQSPQDAFYAFIRTHDVEYSTLMQSQGTASQRDIIDTMMNTLMKYAETLPAAEISPRAENSIPAPILAAYHKWLTGGFSSDFVCLAIETWLKEHGQ